MRRAKQRRSQVLESSVELVLDLELVETRYWWQSLLYFIACTALHIVLAASYAGRGDLTVWVFVINFALCAIIAIAKGTRCVNPNVILALEAVCLHCAIPGAMAVSLGIDGVHMPVQPS